MPESIRRKSLYLLAPQKLAWVVEELPPPGPGEVLVKTTAGAVSVGTEYPLYLGAPRSSQPPSYPRMTGYESLGIIIASGPQVEGLQPGDRVVSFYGHRTHALLPANKAIPVPLDIPDRIALLSILSCDVTKGIDKVQPTPAERVLVTGAGTIGLLTVFNLAARGLENITVVEPLLERRGLARQLGARAVFTPEELPAENEGYPVGFECSSRDRAFELLQQQMSHGGRICILSDGNLEPLDLSPHFHEKELIVVSSSDGVDYPGHARWFFDQAPRRLLHLGALFELDTTADNLPEVFAGMAGGGQRPLKVLVRYQAI